MDPASCILYLLFLVCSAYCASAETAYTAVSKVRLRTLAEKGYLVFSIEYRLVPRANVCEQLDDVCAGMDLIGKKLVDFNVDFTRIFLVSESAGAYLATYVAAMKNSKKLQSDSIRQIFVLKLVKQKGFHLKRFMLLKMKTVTMLKKQNHYLGEMML